MINLRRQMEFCIFFDGSISSQKSLTYMFGEAAAHSDDGPLIDLEIEGRWNPVLGGDLQHEVDIWRFMEERLVSWKAN